MALAAGVVFYTTLIALLVFYTRTHKDEFVVYEVRLVAFLLGFLDPRASMLLSSSPESTYYQASYVVSLALIFGTIVRLMVPLVRNLIRIRSRYLLTEQRVMVVSGLIWLKVTTVPLYRIESAMICSSILFPGSLRLKGDCGFRLTLPWLSDAGTFYTALCQQLVCAPGRSA